MQTKTGIIKRIVDVVLTVLLLFLMAFQVTGEVLHEWLGIGMTVTLVLHHILNRKWYKAVFKGKYSPYRIVMTAVNMLLLAAIAVTALSGMSMSGHAVPFMYGLINVMTARTLHLAMSYWSFILMGVHIGLHMKAMTAKLPDMGRTAFKVILTGVSGVGLWLFLKSGIVNYITFKAHFAFLDFTTAKWLILLQNLAMLLFFVLIGYVLSGVTQKNKDKKYSVKPLVWLSCAMIIGIALNIGWKEKSNQGRSDVSGWQTVQSTTAQTTAQQTEAVTASQDSSAVLEEVDDNYIYIEVGSFAPNAWGLYDCHGNVNEWCWDYYGDYNTAQTADPAGAETGTCHVYRDGGWNDFAKNMRSAYRAAGQADMKSHNLGIGWLKENGIEEQ